ncbi:bifunctional DNA primase/polymerase [Streptomyces sp. 8N114]|uniref:bifunctional DNA primase/polymerase n=1 Tax=Streptomyces sp. 8N114 TaxID=3457419 RepID=UPI003FD549F2
MPLAYALRYAQRGWHVAPGYCYGSPRKHPCINAWQDAASTDLHQIITWWAETPKANVHIVTGEQSNLWVLDIDDKANPVHGVGSATLAALEREHGDLPLTLRVRTGSQGMHYFWTWDGVDFDLRNSAGMLGSGIDTRGNGGQVVAPPSRIDSPGHTGPYVVLDDRAPVAAPAWLLGLLRPVQQPARGDGEAFTSAGSPVQRFRGLVEKVLDTEEGKRNEVLNWAAYRAAEIVKEGRLTREQVASALHAAGVSAGLDEREARATVNSGLASGGAL